MCSSDSVSGVHYHLPSCRRHKCREVWKHLVPPAGFGDGCSGHAMTAYANTNTGNSAVQAQARPRSGCI